MYNDKILTKFQYYHFYINIDFISVSQNLYIDKTIHTEKMQPLVGNMTKITI